MSSDLSGASVAPRSDIFIRAFGPGVYEADRLRLPTHDGQRVVAIQREDVPWLLETLRDFAADELTPLSAPSAPSPEEARPMTENATAALAELFNMLARRDPSVRQFYDTPAFGTLAATVYAALGEQEGRAKGHPGDMGDRHFRGESDVRSRVVSPSAGARTDTERLEWWFSRGMDDSVCEGSVDLWWADEQDGDAVTRVTHGTSLRDALDKAMRGEYEPEEGR